MPHSPLAAFRVALATGILSVGVCAWAQPQVTIGAEDDAAPWSYADGTGYVNDVVRMAFERMGWHVDLKVMPYARCKYLTVQGKLAACFSASKLPDLQDKLVYPKAPVFSAQNWLIARGDQAWHGCDPSRWPKPAHIGTVRGYEYRPAAEQLLTGPQAIDERGDSEVSNLRKLQAGRIDMAMVTVDAVKRLEGLTALAQTSTPFKVVCDFGTEPAYIVFSKQHAQGGAALNAFETGFAQLQSSGALSTLQQTWRDRLLERSRAKPH